MRSEIVLINEKEKNTIIWVKLMAVVSVQMYLERYDMLFYISTPLEKWKLSCFHLRSQQQPLKRLCLFQSSIFTTSVTTFADFLLFITNWKSLHRSIDRMATISFSWFLIFVFRKTQKTWTRSELLNATDGQTFLFWKGVEVSEWDRECENVFVFVHGVYKRVRERCRCE